MLKALDQLGDVGVRVIKRVQGRDDRLAAAAPAGAQPAGRLGRQLRQGLQRLPDLPVRRRGRRPRPAGGAQPAHGRLHQPLDHPRGRPDPGARRPTRPTCLPTELNPGQLLQTTCLDCIASGKLASAACQQGAQHARRRCSSSSSSARSRPTGSRPCARSSTPSPGRARAARRRRSDADPLTRSVPGRRLPLGGLGLGRTRHRAMERRRRTAARPWRQLQAVYDPSLVSLLVPELVGLQPPEVVTPVITRRPRSSWSSS